MLIAPVAVSLFQFGEGFKNLSSKTWFKKCDLIDINVIIFIHLI